MIADKSAELSILVVEDDWMVRDTVATYLRGAGCHVHEAASGESAISLFADCPRVDVVFTDIQLGGRLTGWDIGEALREERPEVAVIYASGCYGVRRPVVGSLLLDKPYSMEAVLDACLFLGNGRHAVGV